MLYRRITYAGLDMSDSRYQSSGIVLQDFQFPLELDTQIEDISFLHGQKTYTTRAKGRKYTVTGKIIWLTPEKRNEALNFLTKTIRPNGLIGSSPVYRLEFEEFTGKRFWTMARVFEAVTYTHNIRDDIVDFSFSLFSDNPAYFSTILKTQALDPKATIGYGKFTGGIDGIHLGYLPEWGNTITGTLLENNWNFEAGVIIEDYTGITDNVYMNLSNGLKYWISGKASARVINTIERPTLITDYWTATTEKRLPQSTGFLLSPGGNLVVAGNGMDYQQWLITLSWYDTYI